MNLKNKKISDNKETFSNAPDSSESIYFKAINRKYYSVSDNMNSFINNKKQNAEKSFKFNNKNKDLDNSIQKLNYYSPILSTSSIKSTFFF